MREAPIIKMEEIKFEAEEMDVVQPTAYPYYLTIPYTVYPLDTTNKSIIWESDNENVAMINKTDGRIAIIGEGTVTITATCVDDYSVIARIVLNATIPVQSVEIINDSGISNIEPGETLQLSSSIYPDEASEKEVTWSSFPERIVEIDETDMVTGMLAGTARIVATVGGKDSAPYSVTVNSDEPISLAEWKTLSPEFESENLYYALGGKYSYTGTASGSAVLQADGAKFAESKGNAMVDKSNCCLCANRWVYRVCSNF